MPILGRGGTARPVGNGGGAEPFLHSRFRIGSARRADRGDRDREDGPGVRRGPVVEARGGLRIEGARPSAEACPIRRRCRGGVAEEAASDAEVVILAVPWKAMEETVARLGDLEGTVVVDITVPYGKDRDAMGRRSSGEVVQKRLPRARVVKGWNHVFAQYLTAPEVDGIAASVLLAGDDPDAKQKVSEVARDMGFHPVDVGPLRASYHLDRLASMMLFVKLGPFRVLTAPP